MKLSPREKLAIQRDTLEIKKKLSAQGLKAKEKITLQRQWKENLRKLDVKNVQLPDSIIDRYLAGAFNTEPVTRFVTVIDEVEKAGATIDQIKAGAKVWAESQERQAA